MPRAYADQHHTYNQSVPGGGPLLVMFFATPGFWKGVIYWCSRGGGAIFCHVGNTLPTTPGYGIGKKNVPPVYAKKCTQKGLNLRGWQLRREWWKQFFQNPSTGVNPKVCIFSQHGRQLGQLNRAVPKTSWVWQLNK